MRIKRFVKTVVAIAPLVIGSATPAYGCLVLKDTPGTGDDFSDPGTAAVHSPQIVCGPVGCGPQNPQGTLTSVDDNPGQGFECDPMCIPGNPDQEGGPED